jgi:multidrug resistance efflux pump
VFVAVVVAVLAVAGYYGGIPQHVRNHRRRADRRAHQRRQRRITGNVVEILAEDEQFVKAGDVLVRIDPRDYEVAVAKAEADLRDAEAALESSRIDIPITTPTRPASSRPRIRAAAMRPRSCWAPSAS